ncbi:MAG: DUF721 domain-containing protein [Saprospiraceae bacterium]
MNMVNRNNNKNKNEEKISDTLSKFIANDKIGSKFHQAGINKIWKDVMGDMVDMYTTSIKVNGDKLILSISSGPLKHELAYNKENLINKINERIGSEFIKDVIIR